MFITTGIRRKGESLQACSLSGGFPGGVREGEERGSGDGGRGGCRTLCWGEDRTALCLAVVNVPSAFFGQEFKRYPLSPVSVGTTDALRELLYSAHPCLLQTILVWLCSNKEFIHKKANDRGP